MADHDSTHPNSVLFLSNESAADVRDRNLRHIQALSAFMVSDEVQQDFGENTTPSMRCEIFDLIHQLAHDASTAQELIDDRHRAAVRENRNG